MTVVSVPTLPSRVQRSRRWLRRAGYALAVFFTLAYVLIPWYVPGPWLAQQIAAILGESFGRPAHVDHASLSWTDGVCIEGVTIDDLPGAGRPPHLARIARIRFGLSPIRTLLRGKVDRLELEGPQLWISLLPDGHLNIDDLDDRRQASLPTLHYMLRNAALHLNLPDLPALCRMDVAECRLDTRTGLLWVSGDATIRPQESPAADGVSVPSGRFWLNGRMRVPKLKRGVKLTGGGELRWENVNLKEIPFRRLPQLGVDSLEGHSQGYLRLEAFPDLGVDYDLRVRLDGVAVQRHGESSPERIRDGLFAASGHWDPAADLLVAKTLDYQMPALRIGDTGRPDRPALVLDRAAAEPLRLDLAGDVTDVEQLRRQFPLIDEALRSLDLQVGKGGRFTVQYSQSPQVARVRLVVDANAVSVNRGDSICLGSGVGKRLAIDVSRSVADGGIDLHEARFDVDDLHWSAKASFPSSPDLEGPERVWIADLLTAAMTNLSFKTQHAERLAAYFPGLDRRLGDGHRRGPVEAVLSLEPTARGPAFRFQAASPAEAELEFGDYFRKPSGVPFSANASWIWDREHPGRWQDLTGECRVGEARITLDGPKAAVEYALTETPSGPHSEEAFEGSLRLHLPIEVSRIEQLLPHLPRAARILDEYRDRIAGDARITLDGAFSYRPNDWAWRGEVQTDLTPARIRAGDAFDKPAGAPASLSVGHRVVRAGDQIEHELTVRGELPGVAADVSYALSGCAARTLAFRTIDAEEVNAGFRLTDARGALAVFPLWSSELAAHEIAGGGSMRLNLLRTIDGSSVSLTAEADSLQWATHGNQPFFKGVGVPCRLGVRVHADKEHADIWTLDPGEARLAGCAYRWQSGEVALSPEWSAWLPAVHGHDGIAPSDRRWQAPPAGRLLERVEIAGVVEAEADSSLRNLAPLIDTWVNRLGLIGRLAGPVRIVASPASVRVTGKLDATRSHFSVVLPDKTRFAKPIGTEASIAVDLERHRGEALPDHAADESIVIHQALLASRDNQVDLCGELNLHAAPDGSPALARGSLLIRTTLNRLDQLQAFLPDHLWPPVRGRLAADVAIDLRDGWWQLGPSDVTLRDVALTAGDIPVHANGRIEFSAADVLCDSLAIRTGTSEMTLSGRAAFSPGPPVIQAGVYAPHIDIDELGSLVRTLSGRLNPDPQSGGPTVASRVWDLLGRSTVDVDVQVDRMQLTVPDLGLRADLRATSGAVLGHDGIVELPVQVSVDGGVVSGRIKFFLRNDKPYFDLAYAAEGLAAKDLVQAYVRRSFPGFVATGPLTLIDRSLQRMGVPPEERNYPVGSGEWIIDGGYVEGKAAPDWMTRIFPGLNLARYDFVRMHDWFTKEEDGRIEHRMIFQGRYYHLYMEGYTDAARNINYEVGIDLLARLDSKYWVESQQGRIPLFIKTGHLRSDGVLEAENVQYTPMRRVIESVVQSNVVKMVYYTIRKQMLNLMETHRGVQ